MCLTTESEEKIFSLLQHFFATEENVTNIFCAKKQIKILKTCCDITLKCSANDPGVADWLVEPESNENNLQDMCLRYCPEMQLLFKDVDNCTGNGSLGCNIYTTVDPRLRASVEASATWHLMSALKDTMTIRSKELLNHFRIEMDCIQILAEMELVGIGISTNQLQFLSEILKKHTRDIEIFAFNIAGRRFNFGSSADVAKILGLNKNSTSSKKRISTSKQVLEHTDSSIAKLVLLWRKLNTTLTHLVQPLLRLVDVSDGRIHGTCVTRTATGRVSMHEPNIQNVPREFQIDYQQIIEVINCRQAFTCKEGYMLISADYCQLELRLLAHLSADSVLCGIMRQKDLDVFQQIAAKWNDIDEKDVTDLLRQNAKKLCYGIIYGMGKKAIGEQLTIAEDEALLLLESFHEKYKCIKEYISKTVKSCRRNGYIETISGRRRFLPNINHHHAATKSQAERQAVNTTIQGSAADIVKKAMVVIDKMFKNAFKTNKPQLVLQIHDELLYEVPEINIQSAANIIKTSMETSVELSVPFPVKVKMGKSWGEMTEYVL